MRTGTCTVQQALTTEAATVVKQAVTLARRRGHTQVTPLHVASTMLAASSTEGLLRAACLQYSHNHPLQCRALELCFNVALNRLPAASPHHHHHQLPQYPSISNALVAAFKRAQAHQRRGSSVETQQQPLLAVKIELEQLVVSILDDPSVSRVMREAGFSSTQVKSNVEQAVFSQQNDGKTTTKENKLVVDNEDVTSVIESLVNVSRSSRRGVVVVGESVTTAEDVVKGVMERVEKGEAAVPEVLRGVEFVSIPAMSSFGQFSDELKVAVRGHMEKGRGVVLNLGDLKWATDDDDEGRSWMEHLIRELGKLRCNDDCERRLWMVGVATFQTYAKCKSSVEAVWGLGPVIIPAGILRLSLVAATDSELQTQSTVNINNTTKSENVGRSSSMIIQEREEENKQQQHNLNCNGYGYGDCSLCSNSDSPTSSNLPAWLQPYKTHNNHDQDSMSIKDLCKKWNSSPNLQITSDDHHYHHNYHTTNTRMKSLTFASSLVSSSPPTSISYLDPTSFHHHQSPWKSSSTTTTSTSLDPIPHHRHNFWATKTLLVDQYHHKPSTVDPALRVYIPNYPNNKHHHHQFFSSSNPNSLSTTPNSTSSSDNTTEFSTHRFNSLNSENLKTLCTAMETKVPRQRHIIPDIATTILQCRSGMVSRRRHSSNANKEDTWLFFQGVDVEAKEEIAKEIAKLVFGSHHRFVSISMSNFSEDSYICSSRSSCKRGRVEDEKSYVERFAEAVGRDPRRVFFVEDVEQADYCSQVGFKRAMESGRVVRRRNSKHGLGQNTSNEGGDDDVDEEEEVGLEDAIVILSCEESFSCRSSRACSPTSKQKVMNEGDEGESPCLSLDLNICVEEEDGDGDEVELIDEIGLLELVDRRIMFKLPREEDGL